MDNFLSFIREDIVLFDIIFLIFIIYFSLQCFAKGFFFKSDIFFKVVLALIMTIILVPKVEPYISDYIDNQYIIGIGFGVFVYILSLICADSFGKIIGKTFFLYRRLGLWIKLLDFSLVFLKVMFL